MGRMSFQQAGRLDCGCCCQVVNDRRTCDLLYRDSAPASLREHSTLHAAIRRAKSQYVFQMHYLGRRISIAFTFPFRLRSAHGHATCPLSPIRQADDQGRLRRWDWSLGVSWLHGGPPRRSTWYQANNNPPAASSCHLLAVAWLSARAQHQRYLVLTARICMHLSICSQATEGSVQTRNAEASLTRFTSADSGSGLHPVLTAMSPPGPSRARTSRCRALFRT
jgi:hypothetical protein